jgi:poly-gamma-glutamate synthesis protein (capsule biosynthesis protein)
VADTLSAPDVMFVNLETAVAEAEVGQPLSNTYVFKSPPVTVDLLREAGVDGVSLANNHSLDYRAEGLARTIELLDEGGILHAGAGIDEAEAYAPVYVETGGRTVAIVGLSRVPCGWAQSGGHPEVAWTCDTWVDRGVAAVKEAAANSDVTAVMVHWGVEKDRCPQQYQRDLAHRWIDAGASIVVGSHPHILQGVEKIHDGWVVHSTGNFAFPSAREERADSALFLFTINGTDVDLSVVPVRIGAGRPVPASNPSTVIDALNRYSFGWQFTEDGHASPGEGVAACGV